MHGSRDWHFQRYFLDFPRYLFQSDLLSILLVAECVTCHEVDLSELQRVRTVVKSQSPPVMAAGRRLEDNPLTPRGTSCKPK